MKHDRKGALALLIFLLLGYLAQGQSFTQMAVSGGLMVASGYADGTREALKFHYGSFKAEHPNANDSYWNPDKSWTRKYKNGDANQGDAFFLSSTALVSLTDGYHLMGLVRNTTAISATTVYVWRSDKDWWTHTPWLRMKWETKKPILAYATEIVFLTGCRGLGFTAAYDWKY